MPAIVTDEFNRRKRLEPRKVVLAAVAKCRTLHVPMTVGETSAIERDGERWTAYNDRPLDIVGAVVVAWDMYAVGQNETAAETMRRILRVAPAWTDGLCDGWRMVPAAAKNDGREDREYMLGFELGAEARFAASVPCPCGARRIKGQDCENCGER